MAYHEWHAKPGYYRDITRHFAEDSRILDVGCGTAWISEYFPDYVGLDNYQSTVEDAASRGIDVRHADLEKELPLADQEFDGIILKDLIEHLLDPVQLLHEVHRVAKPGATIFASSPDAQRWAWNDYTHRRPWTKRAMRHLFEDTGFEVLKVSYESVMPGSGRISALTSRKQRPHALNVATNLPGWRRNVRILARRP